MSWSSMFETAGALELHEHLQGAAQRPPIQLDGRYGSNAFFQGRRFQLDLLESRRSGRGPKRPSRQEKAPFRHSHSDISCSARRLEINDLGSLVGMRFNRFSAG